MIARIVSLIRTGQWRNQLIRMLPRWLGMLVAVLFGFLSILFGVGRGGERAEGTARLRSARHGPRRRARLEGTGRASVHRLERARGDRRCRSCARARSTGAPAGIGVLCYCVYELLQFF